MKENSVKSAHSHHQVAKSATIIGFATLISRILGFIRDLVIARLFGIYVYAQAFVVAFKIPNLFRDFVGEGAANAAFVPVFSEYRRNHSKEEFWELANVVLNLLLIILSILTIVGVMCAPILVKLMAPGFSADPEKLAITIKLCRLIFPYILLVSLAAFVMGLLNSLKHFSVPAFASCFLNISIIVCAIWFGEGIKGLASGILIGGVLQLAIQIPVLYKKGFRIQLFKRFKHPAAALIGRLMVPRLLSSSIYQLNNFVDTIFGSLVRIVGEGGVAALYFAYRLILFPLGICSTALAQAILPTFSEQALHDNYDELKRTLSFGLRLTGFVLWPVSAGFIVMAHPIIAALFEGGKFDRYSTETTSQILVFYTIGLYAYGAIKILQSCFFALKDTRTPTKSAFIALIINIVLNAVLMFPLKLSGIALATSISGISSCLILFFLLKKRIDYENVRPLYVSLGKTLMASIGMGLACSMMCRFDLFGHVTRFGKVLNLTLAMVGSGLVYAVLCSVLKVQEMGELLRWISKKK